MRHPILYMQVIYLRLIGLFVASIYHRGLIDTHQHR
jgi:hypothetical protein